VDYLHFLWNRNMLRWFLALALCVVCVVYQASAVRADWPAFLGGSSRDQQTVSIPLTWSESIGAIWKSPLTGHGQSSPVVIGNNVYLTAVDGPNKETFLVMCVDLASGKMRWTHKIASSLQVKNDPYTSRAAPTPVADSQGVYAFFESGDIAALTPDGAVRWERKLMTDYGQYTGRFGLGGSLAQVADRIFVLADNEGPSYLLSLDKASGETLWKTPRSSRTSWSSPMIMNVASEPQVVTSSAGSLDGYDPQTGKQLWTFTDVGGNTVASPIPFGDGQFLVGAAPGRNGENTEGAQRSNMAVKIVKQGNSFAPEVMWRNEKVTSSFGSPIVYRNRAYYVNRAGVLFCLNAETGATVYNERIKESIWATPLGIGDRVYFFGQTGTTTVVGAGDKFEELAANRLWAKAADGGGPGGFNAEIQYGTALTDRGLLIRTGEHLYLVGSQNPEPR
jgi:outer membrane protein assembly factor BamB